MEMAQWHRQNPGIPIYSRLGGYDAVAAVVDDLLPRLRNDPLLQRFWASPAVPIPTIVNAN